MWYKYVVVLIKASKCFFAYESLYASIEGNWHFNKVLISLFRCSVQLISYVDVILCILDNLVDNCKLQTTCNYDIQKETFSFVDNMKVGQLTVYHLPHLFWGL